MPEFEVNVAFYVSYEDADAAYNAVRDMLDMLGFYYVLLDVDELEEVPD